MKFKTKKNTHKFGSGSPKMTIMTFREQSVFALAIVCLFGTIKSSILNDLHVFTGQLFGDNFINDQNNPFLRDLRAVESVCMDELGCFTTNDSDFFHPENRPINILPYHTDKLNTRFLLYTRMNPDQPFALSYKNSFSLTKSTFNAGRKTKFIVHGLFDNIYIIDWMMVMKDAFLKRGDYNVIVVDWSKGNKFPYTQATANARVVGAEIATLIKLLEKRMGVTQDSVHIVGHSLGSHIAGYAGERLGNLGRISGLDPAGPYFLNMPTKVRLDPSDAKFVDAWHTDADTILLLALGNVNVVGHVDFFPNGGRKQPGCDIDSPERKDDKGIIEAWLAMFSIHYIISGVRKLFACNHDRAIGLFTESINKKPGQCKHMAYACKDAASFDAGKCTDCGVDGKKCAMMGYDMEDTKDRLLAKGFYTDYGYFAMQDNGTMPRKYYVDTTPGKPFCLFHYQVVLEMAGKARDMTLEVVTEGRSKQSFKLNSGSGTARLDSTRTFLIKSSSRLSPSNVRKISLLHVPSPYGTDPFTKSLKIVPLEFSTRRAQISNTIVWNQRG